MSEDDDDEKEGNKYEIEKKRRGRTSPFFYPQVYTERCRERDHKKKTKERERDEKI